MKRDDQNFKNHLEMHREFHNHMKQSKMIEQKTSHRKLNELQFLIKYIHIFRKFTLTFTVVMILFMFKLIGFKLTSFIIVIILIVNEFAIIQMISRLEKRFLNPMSKLQEGVRKISEGDYSIRLKINSDNEIGILTREFNKMAAHLEEGEKLKKEYENNRKELITNISHDLKTPITSINGYVDGLLEKVVPEEKVDNYLKIIKTNASYMNKLIDDLFLFSKLDMQKLNFKFSKTNIKYYIFDIVEEFSFMLSDKGIEFDYKDTIPENIFVNIDGKMLYRAIRNLVDNAIKYGLVNDSLKIEISLSYINHDVVITVKDNGPGIEEDKIQNIFERFYRIDKERTKDLSSTGLGLAIAKEIVESHNGLISVASKLGVETIFTIKLPILEIEGDENIES